MSATGGPAAAIDLSGAWRVHTSDGELARRFTDPSISDADWPEVARPGPLAQQRGIRRLGRSAAVPPDVRAGTARTGPPTVRELRRHLLLRRHLARRRVPRCDRGLLLPAHLRGDRAGPQPARRRPPPRGGGRVPAAAGPHREADDHRSLLTLGQPRPGVEPGWHLAAGPAARHRSGSHQVASRAVPRGHGDAGTTPPRRDARPRRGTGDSAPGAPLRHCHRSRRHDARRGDPGHHARGGRQHPVTHRRGRPPTALVALAARRPAAV